MDLSDSRCYVVIPACKSPSAINVMAIEQIANKCPSGVCVQIKLASVRSCMHMSTCKAAEDESHCKVTS